MQIATSHQGILGPACLGKRGRELVSPLFSLPTVSQFTFVVDWLHTSDLGVAADFAGNCMYLLAQKHFAGNRHEERLKHMWLDFKHWYKVTKCENQYNAMTATMIRKKASSSPKLRGKAGEVRSLVPWLRDVTQRFFAHMPLDSEEAARREA